MRRTQGQCPLLVSRAIGAGHEAPGLLVPSVDGRLGQQHHLTEQNGLGVYRGVDPSDDPHTGTVQLNRGPVGSIGLRVGAQGEPTCAL